MAVDGPKRADTTPASSGPRTAAAAYVACNRPLASVIRSESTRLRTAVTAATWNTMPAASQIGSTTKSSQTCGPASHASGTRP